MWLGVISLFKFLLKAIGVEKGRVETGVHATVWAALSALLIKEFADVVISVQTMEIMNYVTDEGYAALFRFLPKSLQALMSNANGREALYTGVTGIGSIGTILLALKNYHRLVMGRPKSNRKKRE